MIFLIVLFSIASAVWIGPLLTYGRTILLATMVLLVGTVVGPAFLSIPAPIPITVDRVLWLAMFGLVLVRLRQGELVLSRLTRIDIAVIAWMGWLLISALMGGPGAKENSPIARWLFYVAMPIGTYAVVRVSEITAKDMKWVERLLLGLGIYLSVTAILEVSGFHALVFPRYIVNGKIWEFFGRARGPLLNPSGNAVVMTISLVIAILGFIQSNHRVKFAYAGLVTLILAGIYCTLTRSSWMGGIAAVAVIVWVYSPRWLRVLGLASMFLLGAAGAAGLKDQFMQMKRDKNLSAADAEKSVQLRPLLAIVAWEMFKERPILGHGFGHYLENSEPYHTVRSYGLPLDQARPYTQHNIFLSILVDAGLVGLLLFLGILTITTAVSWQMVNDKGKSQMARHAGFIWLGGFAGYFCNGMFQDVTMIPMSNMFMFFIAALAVTVYGRSLNASPLASPPVTISGTGLPIAVLR
ncbi:O-Antigen ligase [Novipirellula aureliae]|uniref:O-Antigen ligase n=1 Tax=Novipirellula aureliae TaxID=2527966 RepID=A0A5C6E8R5_9BACT|nr:O-antigen ligase family protein [Novipirellula aureliae]TWU44091.1 O-Antigen ligase [Novipirellula aureliae]